MRITLAYACEGHDPDETVDLPDDVARRLVNDGRARLPAAEVAPEPTPAPRRTTTQRGSGRKNKEN